MLGPFGADAMRSWARSLVRDNAYAWNVVDTIVSNVVGAGITAQSTYETPDGEDVEDVNEIRDATFAEWSEVCDINGELTLSEIQALCQREITEAGEVLVRLIKTSGKEYRGISRPVPLALELIEADRLSLNHDTFIVRASRLSGNRIIRGVELDDKGKAIAYWIYPEHPNSPYTVKNQIPERVPAAEILHLYRKDRVGQSRGISWFAPIMSPMRDLGTYIDNELQASAISSCFTVFIKSNSPTGSLLAPEGEDATDKNGNSLDYIEPGIISRLATDESVEFANPSRPNSGSEPWINLMLRGIAAGTGTNYEAVAKDFSKTSYSSSRTSKLEDRPRVKRWQNFIVWHLCQPIWDEFCNAAARQGLDGFPTSTELLESRRNLAPVEWQLPEQEWVDPAGEQTAAHDSITAYMSTYQDELGSRGRSWRATFYQAAKEKKLRMQLGLLKPEEQTAQMMAAQTGAEGPADAAQAEQQDQAGSGEWMGLSRLQWNRNRKALTDVLNGLADGSMSSALAKAQLSMIGLTQPNIDAIVADASDGTVDNPVPIDQKNDGNTDTITRRVERDCGTGAGGFKPGNTCPKGGGGKDSSKTRTKAKPLSAKAEAAKKSAKLTDKSVQQAADKAEHSFAKRAGGAAFKNSEPVDVVVAGKSGVIEHGIEHKYMHDNANSKITMNKYAQVRKLDWEKKNKATFHTVVETKSGDMFYRRGVGSFRVGGMHKITGGHSELKKLLSTPDKQLPTAAQRTDHGLKKGSWKKQANSRGYVNTKTGEVANPKK
jgi:lambda family phage portal protein